MTEYSEWPDFDGPRPVDTWPNPLHWEAAKAIHGGATHIEAGHKVGRARQTVSGWVRSWRTIYGPDFLPDQPGLDEDPAKRRHDLGGKATAKRWADERKARAWTMKELSDLAGEVTAEGLKALLESGEAGKLDSADLERMARIAERLSTMADRLMDQPLAAGGHVGDSGVPEGLLAGLETKPGQHAGLLERFDVVRTSYLRMREAGQTPEGEDEAE